jgi:molybdenum cofactor cytidylyltransferase
LKPQSDAVISNSLFAMVLAAGTSTRFGTTKQLAEIDGKPMVRRAVRLAEYACEERFVLVAGNRWMDVHEACSPLKGYLVINDDFETGIATSIATGVKAISESADALLLILADQPLITERYLDRMIKAWSGSETSIVCSEFANTVGPPVIFPSAYFAELTRLEGDKGARRLLELHAENVIRLPFEDAAMDIDVPADLLDLKR